MYRVEVPRWYGLDDESDPQQVSDEFEDLQFNLKEIIASTVSIESAMSRFISNYFCPIRDSVERRILEDELVRHHRLSLAAKAEIIKKVIEREGIDSRPYSWRDEPRDIPKLLNAFVGHRNRFAHGFPEWNIDRFEFKSRGKTKSVDEGYLKKVERDLEDCWRLMCSLDFWMKRRLEQRRTQT